MVSGMKYLKEGAECFNAGTPVEKNPYPPGSYPHAQWLRGWDSAWYKTWKENESGQ